tara:strand:- start:156 stop:482 length:327 start_codon:yes stop_codon:yes gene_type:complete
MSKKIFEVTESSFSDVVLNSNQTVIVDFWAPWCGPCKHLMPVLESVLEEKSDVILAKVNVDEEMSLANQYQVKGLPTLLLFKNGILQATHVGLATKEKLIAFVQQESA